MREPRRQDDDRKAEQRQNGNYVAKHTIHGFLERREIGKKNVAQLSFGARTNLGVEVVGGLEPFFQIGVNFSWRSKFDAVGDTVFFGKTAGVDQAFR
jgi:hypothetical protein